MIDRRRYLVLAILFLAYLLCYMDRMAMASAIPLIAREFQLSPLAMGSVLSAFFIGYAAMQIPGGLLADRFGPNLIMTAAIACWSFFTAATGLAGSLVSMLVIRICFGLSEGPYPPAASKAVAQWFPQNEIGRANGAQLAAANVGAAVAPMLIAPLIIHWGWRAAFYALLIPGLILALLVKLIVKDRPRNTQGAGASVGSMSIKQALAIPALWWGSLALFFTNIGGWGLMNWLPTYLLQARGFGIGKMGMLASLPYLAGALGYLLGGYLTDKYFRQRRHVPILSGVLFAAALTYLAVIAPTGEWAVAALTPAFLFLFIAAAGLFTLPLVLVPPEAVGGAFGFVNTVGQTAGFLSPLLVGYILNAAHGDFRPVFYFIIGLFIAAACAAIALGRVAHRRNPSIPTE